jgi:hypothetical protein
MVVLGIYSSQTTRLDEKLKRKLLYQVAELRMVREVQAVEQLHRLHSQPFLLPILTLDCSFSPDPMLLQQYSQ